MARAKATWKVQAKRTPGERWWFFRALLGCIVAIVNILTTSPVNADKTEAGTRFAQGEEAFRRGEYLHAAELFEAAHEAAAHHDSAWNAAQAWLSAGDHARGATWLAVFLVESPPSAPDRAAGKAKLDELSPTLGRLDIEASGFDVVRIDGKKTPGKSAYVLPGEHRVDGRAGEKTASAPAVRVGAGESARVVLLLPREDPRPPPITPEPTPSRGLSPLVVIIGGTVTVGLAATSIAFGVATENAHDDFAANRSQDALDGGQAKQDLSNGFFWGAVGVGVVTAVIAAFFVDWKKPIFSF
jgi:hypothetical protein